MTYKVGDKVIHWAYGSGDVVGLDEKSLSGQTSQYYVVKVKDMTIWVPVTDVGESCLRPPTPARHFNRLFKLLASPPELLSVDRFTRKNQLSELMKDRSLESLCCLVRDLSFFKRSGKKTNENDTAVLEHAQTILLNEWSVAFKITVDQAHQKLTELLSAHPNSAGENPETV